MITVTPEDRSKQVALLEGQISTEAQWIIEHATSPEIPQRIQELGVKMWDFFRAVEKRTPPLFYFCRKILLIKISIQKLESFAPATIAPIAKDALKNVRFVLELMNPAVRNPLNVSVEPVDFLSKLHAQDIPFLLDFLENSSFSNQVEELAKYALKNKFFDQIAEPLMLYHFGFLSDNVRVQIKEKTGKDVPELLGQVSITPVFSQRSITTARIHSSRPSLPFGISPIVVIPSASGPPPKTNSPFSDDPFSFQTSQHSSLFDGHNVDPGFFSFLVEKDEKNDE